MRVKLSTASAMLMLMLHSSNGSAACPAGQLSATRIEYQGRINTVFYPVLPREMLPHLGITKRTTTVADGGYFKEVDEGMTIRTSKSSGQAQITPTLYVSEVPMRRVRIETPALKMSFDELSDKPGTRHQKTHLSVSAGMRDSFTDSYSPVANAPQTGEAEYAGVRCSVRSETVLSPDGKYCVATVRSRGVVLAQDWTDRSSKERQSMHATRITKDVCVTAAEFEAPTSVRFKQ